MGLLGVNFRYKNPILTTQQSAVVKMDEISAKDTFSFYNYGNQLAAVDDQTTTFAASQLDTIVEWIHVTINKNNTGSVADFGCRLTISTGGFSFIWGTPQPGVLFGMDTSITNPRFIIRKGNTVSFRAQTACTAGSVVDFFATIVAREIKNT